MMVSECLWNGFKEQTGRRREQRKFHFFEDVINFTYAHLVVRKNLWGVKHFDILLAHIVGPHCSGEGKRLTRGRSVVDSDTLVKVTDSRQGAVTANGALTEPPRFLFKR